MSHCFFVENKQVYNAPLKLIQQFGVHLDRLDLDLLFYLGVGKGGLNPNPEKKDTILVGGFNTFEQY